MNWKFWQKKKADQPAKKKSKTREWTDAIVFAVIAATIIRTFFIEAYTIPTGSMEKSLLIGDFLFVSKVNYGARIPMTPIAFPFAHHTMPITGTKAYWDGLELKYRRLPGLSDVKRNDVVVFNYPMEADAPFNRPVDKRENYIKRCIGIGGDTIKIVNAQVYVNGKPSAIHEQGQSSYIVQTNTGDMNTQPLEELGINIHSEDIIQMAADTYRIIMTKEAAAKVKTWSYIKAVTEEIEPAGVFNPQVFPHDPRFKWNADNFGDLIIPKKGWTVKLDTNNFLVYRRAIEIYEGNKVEVSGNNIMINGAKADSYTFKLNYFWMMGDSRHNSLDSRYWGFVPEDHIVGKALFVWMSWDTNGSFLNKIRWNRILKGIH